MNIKTTVNKAVYRIPKLLGVGVVVTVFTFFSCQPDQKRIEPVPTNKSPSTANNNNSGTNSNNNSENNSNNQGGVVPQPGSNPNNNQPAPQSPPPTVMCATELSNQVGQQYFFYKVQQNLPGLYRIALQQPPMNQQSFLMQALNSDTCANLRMRYP